MLYLKKMNLELFKDKNAAPSDSWWERLFNSHGDIAFDDYDKDFTDLPTPIAEVSVLVYLYLLFEHRTDQLHCARHSPSQPPKMRQVYCRREKRKNIRSAKPHANVMTSESARDKCAWPNFAGASICRGLSSTDAIPRRILWHNAASLRNSSMFSTILPQNDHNQRLL